MRETVSIHGKLGDIISRNKDNNIAMFWVNGQKDTTTMPSNFICTGYLPMYPKNAPILVTGITRKTKKGYIELNTGIMKEEGIKLCTDTERDAIDFIISADVLGIGEKTAKKIVDVIGNDVLAGILDKNTFDKLIESKIAKDKQIFNLQSILCRNKYILDIADYIRQFGGDINDASFLFSLYKNEAIAKIKANPYIAAEKNEISFSISDGIGAENNVSPFTQERIVCLINKAFARLEAQGNTAAEEDRICSYVRKVQKRESVFEIIIPNIIIKKTLENSSDYIKSSSGYQRSEIYLYESFIAKKLIDLSVNGTNLKIKSKCPDVLDNEQKKAFSVLFKTGVYIINGGPGSGKTFTIISIVNGYKESFPKKSVLLCAPTGKAAQRMSEMGAGNAVTMQSAVKTLEMKIIRERKEKKKEKAPEHYYFDSDFIIIDEMSMVDTKDMNDFLKYVAPGTTLIMVGDAAQLPSVGCGKILKDCIDCKLFPTFSLKSNHRQGNESLLNKNSIEMRDAM